MPTSAINRKATQATAVDLAMSIPSIHRARGQEFNIAVKTAGELFLAEREQIWHLFAKNMHALYVASSFGWDPRAKKRELFDSSSRFVIVRPREPADALSPIAQFDEHTHSTPRGDTGIVAYTMFRFTTEEDQEILYCYELQVCELVRRCGLGKLLMQTLYDIGAAWGMCKVMLTVFKANQPALEFYSSARFSTDETSPDHPDNLEHLALDTYDYTILSMRIEQNQG